MRACFAVLLLATLFAGCGGAGTPPGSPALPVASQSADKLASAIVGKYVKHIVIVVQENRSFDNIFDGFPGANTTSYGYAHDGTQVPLHQIEYQVKDMGHYFSTGVMDWDGGKMDRFDLNPSSGGTIGTFAYSYLDRNAVAPYWAIARKYVLADAMFPTMFGPSFTAHLDLIAGTANLDPSLSLADVPGSPMWGCDSSSGTGTNTVDAQRVVRGNGPFPCLTQFRTMADALDAARVSWKYYGPQVGGDPGQIWSAFDAIKSVRYGPDWQRHVVSPPTQIFKDAAAGNLPSVSWVAPDYLWSDHPYAGTDYGPSWVASLVNKIGTSPEWKSTAIVVVWDDWGGFYDNAAPPQLDFRGLGIRVGCLIVSPYAVPHVDHTQFEFGSILKFVEQAFRLPALGKAADGYTDGRAASLAKALDFSASPRPFSRIPAKYQSSFFAAHAASRHLPDDQ